LADLQINFFEVEFVDLWFEDVAVHKLRPITIGDVFLLRSDFCGVLALQSLQHFGARKLGCATIPHGIRRKNIAVFPSSSCKGDCSKIGSVCEPGRLADLTK